MGLDTKLLMIDGTTKPVQDIKVNDILVGPDSQPRVVTSVFTGSDELIEIIPNDPQFCKFTCTKDHKLSLSSDDNFIFNVSVSSYMELKAGWNLWKPNGSKSKFNTNLVGLGTYFGFEVDGTDSLVLLGDYTVTSNSGKTVSASARVIDYCLDNPGCVAIIGGINYPLIKRTVEKEWQDRFTTLAPWDHLQLQNRLIIKKPTQNAKDVIFANGTIARIHSLQGPKGTARYRR